MRHQDIDYIVLYQKGIANQTDYISRKAKPLKLISKEEVEESPSNEDDWNGISKENCDKAKQIAGRRHQHQCQSATQVLLEIIVIRYHHQLLLEIIVIRYHYQVLLEFFGYQV